MDGQSAADALLTGVMPTAEPAPQPAPTAAAPTPGETIAQAITAPAQETPAPAAQAQTAPEQTAPAAQAAPAPTTTWVEDLIGGGETKPQTFDEQVNSFFQSQFQKKPEEFIKDYGVIQEKVATLEKVKADHDQLNKGFDAAPLRMKNAITEALRTGDWAAYDKYMSSTPNFDFSKEAKQQDAVKLVDHYFPGTLSADDKAALANGDADESVKAVVNRLSVAAQPLYDKDRTEETGRIARYETESRQFAQQRDASIDASFAELKAKHPKMYALATDELRQGMKTYDALLSRFQQPDGTWKPDAARKLVLLDHLDEVIGAIQRSAKQEATVAAVQDATDRLPDGIRQTGQTQPATPQKDDRSQREKDLDFLTFGKPK